jgi:hypothetical protein
MRWTSDRYYAYIHAFALIPSYKEPETHAERSGVEGGGGARGPRIDGTTPFLDPKIYRTALVNRIGSRVSIGEFFETIHSTTYPEMSLDDRRAVQPFFSIGTCSRSKSLFLDRPFGITVNCFAAAIDSYSCGPEGSCLARYIDHGLNSKDRIALNRVAIDNCVRTVNCEREWNSHSVNLRMRSTECSQPLQTSSITARRRNKLFT